MSAQRRFQRVLVTGGCGFVGSHLVRRLLDDGAEVVNLDLLTYAGCEANVADVAGRPGYAFVRGDIADGGDVARAAAGCDAIVNVAAETHVDRSLMGGDEFVRTNVLGTKRLLDWVAGHPGIRFVQVSTDEVYGDVPHPRRSTEDDPLLPSSPYAAAKAGADLLVLAAVRTHGVDASIVRGANAYGPNQFPEKLIPLLTIRALRGEPLPLYGDGLQQREFTFVEDFASAIATVLASGVAGGVYNASAEEAQVNLETARRIVALAGVSADLIRHVADRPGHDRRYAIGSARLRALGWAPRTPFADGLPLTVRWLAANEAWWRPIVDGDGFTRYVEANYGARDGEAVSR